MILHSKPAPFGKTNGDGGGWRFRGSVIAGKPRPDKEVEEEKKEFLTEEEFKV